MAALRPAIVRIVRLLVLAFFRRTEVVGLEHVPPEGGGIVVSWHPNGLIDPGVIFATFPRPVVFGARDGLFRWPVLGWMIRAVDTVPIYRAEDRPDQSPEERRRANAHSLDALARAVASGQITCLFPEGESHDAPHMLAFKTGVARFYYQARQLQRPGEPPPMILPAGLHYDAKRRFRSSALVTYYPPLRLPPDLDVTPPEDEPEEVSRERNQRLTDLVERALQEVVHATESWRLHFLLHRASKLRRAERAKRAGVDLGDARMHERQVGFARMWALYNHAAHARPQELQAVVDELAEYDADLRTLGLEDHELDRTPRAGRIWPTALTVAQVVAVFVVLPAPLVLGGIVNLVPTAILKAVALIAAREDKDVATIVVLLGAWLYPLTWLVAGGLGAWAATELHDAYPVIPSQPGFAALVVMGFGVVGGMAALRYVRLVRETARAMRVRLTRARQRLALAHLSVERDELTDALEALEAAAIAEGAELPGVVTADGAVVASEP